MTWPDMTRTQKIMMMLTIMIILFSLIASGQTIKLVNDQYTVWYNCRTMVPDSVTWVIQPRFLGNIPRSNKFNFRVDKRCPRPRAATGDYTNTGYQRGHICPSADFNGDENLMKQTFMLSNICPQPPAFNKGEWYVTEMQSRMEAIRRAGVRVIVNTYFLKPDTSFLSGHRIAIPDAFRKRVFTLDTDSLLHEWYFVLK